MPPVWRTVVSGASVRVCSWACAITSRDRPARAPAWLPRSREALDCGEELAALRLRGVFVAGGKRARHAALDVLAEDLEGDGVEGGRRGADLRQDVDAV